MPHSNALIITWGVTATIIERKQTFQKIKPFSILWEVMRFITFNKINSEYHFPMFSLLPPHICPMIITYTFFDTVSSSDINTFTFNVNKVHFLQQSPLCYNKIYPFTPIWCATFILEHRVIHSLTLALYRCCRKCKQRSFGPHLFILPSFYFIFTMDFISFAFRE